MNSTSGYSTRCTAIRSPSSSGFSKREVRLLVSRVESGWVISTNIKADVTIGIKQEQSRAKTLRLSSLHNFLDSNVHPN